ncbi:MAG: sulfotransferase family protein [Phycisphaerae bacterium]|jgi:hypothetical protein
MATRNFLTIVSGLPRSGTSMMMRMLDEGGLPAITDNIRKPDADNPKGYYEFEPVKKTKEDPSWVNGSEGKVVKMVYRLLYDLPAGRQYRVIMMRRNLDEVIKSQEVMLERSGKAGGKLSDDKLKKMFADELAKVEAWMDERGGFQYVEIDYNDMLKNPVPLAARINQFLDGGLDEAKMAAVVDPSLYRQRKS